MCMSPALDLGATPVSGTAQSDYAGDMAWNDQWFYPGFHAFDRRLRRH